MNFKILAQLWGTWNNPTADDLDLAALTMDWCVQRPPFFRWGPQQGLPSKRHLALGVWVWIPNLFQFPAREGNLHLAIHSLASWRKPWENLSEDDSQTSLSKIVLKMGNHQQHLSEGLRCYYFNLFHVSWLGIIVMSMYGIQFSRCKASRENHMA
jgi:hypothetical protein